MTFFLKLRHWELTLMLALPTFLCFMFMFRVPFLPLIFSTIALFLMIVLFGWMFSICAWCNSKLSGSGRGSIVGYGCSLALPIPLGLWVIQPSVNQLYHRLTPSEMFSNED